MRAHSARSWLGVERHPRRGAGARRGWPTTRRATVDVDGLTYREGLNAVGISGGVAGNVIPDECTVTVNFRFAPDRSEDDALAHVRDGVRRLDVELTDSAPARPAGAGPPVAAAFVAAVGGEPRAKLGWTDVARFGELGIRPLNFGPGDPNLAHKPEEHVVGRRGARRAEAALVGSS